MSSCSQSVFINSTRQFSLAFIKTVFVTAHPLDSACGDLLAWILSYFIGFDLGFLIVLDSFQLVFLRVYYYCLRYFHDLQQSFVFWLMVLLSGIRDSRKQLIKLNEQQCENILLIQSENHIVCPTMLALLFLLLNHYFILVILNLKNQPHISLSTIMKHRYPTCNHISCGTNFLHWD